MRRSASRFLKTRTHLRRADLHPPERPERGRPALHTGSPDHGYGRESVGPGCVERGRTRASDGFLVRGGPPGHFAGHHAISNQRRQRLIESAHPELPSGLNRGVHLSDPVFPDQVPDGGSPDHDLVGGDASTADLLEQRLSNGCSSDIDSSCGTFAGKRHHVVGDDDVLRIGLGEQCPRLVEA